MHGPLCDPLCPLWFVFVPRLPLAVFAVKRSFVAFVSSFGQLDLLRVTGGGAILSWRLLHHCDEDAADHALSHERAVPELIHLAGAQ